MLYHSYLKAIFFMAQDVQYKAKVYTIFYAACLSLFSFYPFNSVGRFGPLLGPGCPFDSEFDHEPS